MFSETRNDSQQRKPINIMFTDEINIPGEDCNLTRDKTR